MAFADDLNGFTRKVNARNRAIFIAITVAIYASVVFGSAITGSPGQPVDTGALRASWIGEFVSAYEWTLTTNIEYAPIIEYNLRGATLRSAVGGFHSVSLTALGFERIVEHVTAQAAA